MWWVFGDSCVFHLFPVLFCGCCSLFVYFVFSTSLCFFPCFHCPLCVSPVSFFTPVFLITMCFYSLWVSSVLCSCHALFCFICFASKSFSVFTPLEVFFRGDFGFWTFEFCLINMIFSSTSALGSTSPLSCQILESTGKQV